jgi:hypothetical protein
MEYKLKNVNGSTQVFWRSVMIQSLRSSKYSHRSFIMAQSCVCRVPIAKLPYLDHQTLLDVPLLGIRHPSTHQSPLSTATLTLPGRGQLQTQWLPWFSFDSEAGPGPQNRVKISGTSLFPCLRVWWKKRTGHGTRIRIASACLQTFTSAPMMGSFLREHFVMLAGV